MNERVATDLFRLALRRTDGPLTEEQAAELLALVCSGLPRTTVPKAKYRRAEFPDEVAEQITTDIARVVAGNPARERELAANPPAPDARAARIAAQEERVRQAAAGLAALVRVKSKRKETDD